METLEKFIGTNKQPTFAEFRKFVLSRYEARFDNNPEIKALIADVDYEGNVRALNYLFIAYEDIKEMLHEFDIYEDFLVELDLTYMNDYFLLMEL